MNIILSPQVRDRNKIWYEVEENVITATIDGKTDTFDFTGMPNGELQLEDEEGEESVQTILPENPILSAKKVNGVLTVKILFSMDIDEKDERLLFPEPMTVSEFNGLMKELAKRKSEKKEEVELDG